MNGCQECRALSRRGFLRRGGVGLGVAALGDSLFRRVAETYAQSAGGTGNLLVLCELNGGLDALSVLAPFANGAYQSNRPHLALKEADVVTLHDTPGVGINKQLQFFADLYQAGQLAVVQQVAYPDGNGSHFESQEIFEYGVRNLGSRAGANAPWYERLRHMYFDSPFGVLDTRRTGDPREFGYPDGTYRKAAQDAFGRLARMKSGGSASQQGIVDTYKRIDVMAQDIRTKTQAFRSSGQARGEFFRAAALASAGLGTQILRVRYSGFDTHGSQVAANSRLFPALNSEFRQFVQDLQALGLWERTTVAFYSEFGRRNYENGSPGTDHGYGGHMFLAGPRVRGGLHGQTVTSSDLNEDSLPYYVDFRAVFSAVVRDWLGFNPQPLFKLTGESFNEEVGSALFR